MYVEDELRFSTMEITQRASALALRETSEEKGRCVREEWESIRR